MPKEIEYIGKVQAARDLKLAPVYFDGVCQFFGIRPYQLTSAWMKHLKKAQKDFRKKHVDGMKNI